MNKIKILIVVIFFGCSQKENLNHDFKSVLINYQNKFPIPKLENKGKKRIYIYSAYFWKNKNDTLLVITRSSSGIMPNSKGLGIYEDRELKPTFIVDEDSLGTQFILNKIVDIKDNFYWREKKFPESFPPVYTYKVKNTKLELVKIDTIWKKWD